MFFDQLATISKHLQNIKHDKKEGNINLIRTKIDHSTAQTKRYFLKMLHAFATQSTLKAAKTILPKNKRNSTK